MRIFKTKVFARFARKTGIGDAALLQAADAVAAGTPDADLGGGVFKQRVARKGEGKSGGFRTILIFRSGGHCFFAYGFAKNEKPNISPKELIALKLLAGQLLSLGDRALQRAASGGEIIEVDAEIGRGRQEQG